MKLDELEYEARSADRAAHEALSLMVKRAEQHAKELRGYLDRLECATTQLDKINALNWAINASVQGVQNYRIDRIASAQADLTAVAKVRRALGLQAQNDDCQMLVILSKTTG